ncbi:CRISPR-associated endonuclease Cas1 [Sneathiella sp.]|uniref:CRISPR-associated endonuclease Cas1 n=1 Tax=Sneathiella sp. TaxID=1964365 RepID=UPI0035669013
MDVIGDVALNRSPYQDEWADRCIYWNYLIEANKPKRMRRERQSHPLIITGHGLSITVDKKRLIIKDGNTHYPSKPKVWEFFKGDLELPPRIVVIDGSGNITLDALDWLADQDVPLIRIKFDGTGTTVMSPSGFSADRTKVAWQLETRDDPDKKLAFAISITRQKLEASIETLEKFVPSSKYLDRSIEAIRNDLAFIERGDADTPAKLLGQEGKAASSYWRAWQGVEMKWRATTRHPIPDDWRTYLSRSSILTGVNPKNKNASHPINAMLNYAYAALLTKAKIQAICDGYDPMIGILHDQRHKEKDLTPSFALDLMEPQRPVVDRVILKLIAEQTFSGSDFDIQSNGVCRLNPALARSLMNRMGQ